MDAQIHDLEAIYFDTHFHGRRRPLLDHVMPLKAERACGAFLEPNTKPHLTTYDAVQRSSRKHERSLRTEHGLRASI